MHVRVLVCLLTILATPLLAPAAPPAANVPAIVQAAAQTAASTSAGAVVFERHITILASAGPAHYEQRSDAVLLMTNGAYRRIHYLWIDVNGRPLDPAQTSRRDDQNNRDLEAGKDFFKEPFDGRYLADYRYAIVPCACSGNAVDVRFSSDVHDNQHGRGDMRIDPSTGRVLALSYSPNVLPEYATGGTIDETFGEPVPGLWTTVRSDSTYVGRVLFIPGRGTVTEVLDHFHRFTDASAGETFYRTAMLAGGESGI
ncbi:MAG TPA: hypothetical protein VMF11_09045 [Candidatus Baltobacteraceae bacterium]|nr:hypothetical protein [Candidatus Baltobacteraceae bacterium]